MILTFTLTSGEQIGINMDCIVTIVDNGNCRSIVTVVEDYEVEESYSQCVNGFNQVKLTHDFRTYVNYSRN